MPRSDNPNIASDWHLLKLRDTDDFREGFLASLKVANVWSFYLFDKSRHVYCCSITPAYECTYVAFDYAMRDDATDEEREAAFGELLESYAGAEDVHYRDVHDLDRLGPDRIHKACEPDTLREEDVDADVALAHGRDGLYWTQLEELREHYQGNTPGW